MHLLGEITDIDEGLRHKLNSYLTGHIRDELREVMKDRLEGKAYILEKQQNQN